MKSSYLTLSLSLSVSAMYLTSCAPSKISSTEKDKSATHSEALKTEKTETEIKSKEIGNAVKEPAVKDSGIKSSAVATAPESDQAGTALDEQAFNDLAKKLQSSRLDGLANSTIICTVNGDPITVGDYRHQFKTEQEEMQAKLAVNPQVANNLIQMAQEKGVALSVDEKKHLISSANKMQAGGSKGFNAMLSENHMTKNQFQDQVFDVGLAFKMAGKLIEEGLLKELVSRKLLSQAAKENGFSKEALNKFTEVSKSPQYKRLLQVSGISADDLRDEIITNELCLQQIEKVKNESPITDTEISNYYEKNRGKFRHEARVRLSQIYISRANDVTETPTSLKMKLKKENPKLSEDEIDKQITDLEKKKAKLAQDLLQRARNGEDFANLANQYSEDLAKTGQKNGGDVGFQEEAKLEKFFADKVSKLPAGGITPEIIVSPYGYHIFKVTARENKGFYNLSEIKEVLKRLLAQEKGQQVMDDWLSNARKKANIAISPSLKDLIAANKLPKRAQ